MNKEELDSEIDKIHEEGDKMFIPNSIVNEVFCLAVKREIRKYNK